jgi:16S rRNA (adenine1518-N6/adenine1519-N6)-dimethyltransferase
VGRRLGQHFLARKSILDRIAQTACGDPASGDRVPIVIEIGPGKGALTESLLQRAERVIAIEVDTYLVHYLRQKFREPVEQGRLVLIEGDILKTDLSQWGRVPIVGNLPYYITSPILERVFSSEGTWERAVFLMQAEVAARLAAEPGGRDRGYLSVLTQLHSTPEVLFEVPRVAFRPPPKVDSAVVLLTPRKSPVDDTAAFLRFASACFRMKRKTLRNNLAPAYGRELLDTMPEAGLRAEQMNLDQLTDLYRRLVAGSKVAGR